MNRGLKLVLALLVALLCGLAWRLLPPAGDPGQGNSAGKMDFVLQGGDGPVALTDLRGRVVLVNFGYTYCPDVCPTVLANLASALKKLSADEMSRLSVVFISVDPDRDTPKHLKEYAAFFHPAIVGATGTAAEIAQVAARYGAFYARQKANESGQYVVDHSSEIYVVDGQGRLAAKVGADLPPDRLAAEIRKYF